MDFLFLFSFIGWLDASQEAAVLVDPLEALRVLHSHEEFLSQVLKWFVSGQVQAVETEDKKKKFDYIKINKNKYFKAC